MSDSEPISTPGRSPGEPPPSRHLVRTLPKAELHVHVEGAVAPATIASIALRNGVDLGLPPGSDDPAELYRYDGLEDFLRVFDVVCRTLQHADDLHQVTYEALGIAARAGVRYREMFFSPSFLMRHGVAFTTIWDGIAAGIADAERDHGIACRMIMDVHKPAGPAAAEELIDLASRCDRDVLIGIGGDGGEHGVDLAGFAGPFDRARRLGFHTTIHVGEEGPVADLATAVRVLNVERLDHGVPLLDDPSLVAEVVERGLALTCCPTSNREIGVIEEIADHPIMAMRDAGVTVTVNSDNAEMFGVDVADELSALVDAFDLTTADVVELCLNGVEAAWVDDAERRSMRATFRHDIDLCLGASG
jgi:adenosine deaminase